VTIRKCAAQVSISAISSKSSSVSRPLSIPARVISENAEAPAAKFSAAARWTGRREALRPPGSNPPDVFTASIRSC
jgi:hypothetical protein